MVNRQDYQLGIMYRREHAPENLPDFARKAEAVGFDELWVVEDCFYGSGIAAAAAALACTDTLTVGLGIMPAVVRNPVFAAMEIATLARLFPGRFLPGYGHGVTEWMHQVGAFPKSQLRALEEVTLATRELLAGKQISLRGEYVQIDKAELVHPPDRVPPVSLGVIGPKSLALSGRVADGTILSEYSSPAYVTWARKQIVKGELEQGLAGGPAGSLAASHPEEHRLTVFAFACADSTTAGAHKQLRPMLADALSSDGSINPKVAALGITSQVSKYLEEGNLEQFAARLPGDWIDQMAIAGTPEDWHSSIDRLVEVGVHSVVLVPLPDQGPDEIDTFADHILASSS